MADFLRVFLCLCVCVNIVLCQFGFFPQREDRFQRPQFGHIRNPKRIRDRLSGILHFVPENQNSNPAFIYPFNEKPQITYNGPNYDQYGRPIISYQNNQNYVNPYEEYNSRNPVVFPTSRPEVGTNQLPNQLPNVNQYQPNQNPQSTQSDQQLNTNQNKPESNVIFQEIPNQGSNIFIYPNQEKPGDIASNQQSGINTETYQPTENPQINEYQPNQNDNTQTTQNPLTQVNFEAKTESTLAYNNFPTLLTTQPTQFNSISDQSNNQEAATEKTTELPKNEGSQSVNSGSVNFGSGNSYILSGSSTLPPLTPVPASEVGNNFNFGARGLFSETCETIDNEIGSCISVFQCPQYLKIIQNHKADPASVQLLRRVHCGFEGNNPKVCCPREGIPTDPPTEPTVPTTTTTTTTTTTPAAVEPEGKNIGTEDFISVMPEPPICGLSNASFSRVVGGVDAKIGDFPWMALLGYKGRRNPGVRWLCGGSLVSSRHVLTAAHCIHGHEDDLYLVRLGELDLARDDEGATPVDVLIKKKIKHEEYDANSFTSDIGILVLDRDIGFTNLIKPICIPKDSELRARSFENYNPIIAGWGDTEFRGPSATLLQALQLPVVSNEFCSQAYAKYKPQKIDQRVLCAGYKKGGKDACQGDSGGPLMQPIWDSEVFTTYFYQIGVVSYGKKCAEAGFPGVYSRVTHFVPWIESKLIGV